ncbi:hypothetical protein WOLCODRAFT_133703 [Wolfiporia cocos MD-104 SS10]|uniref:Uncharacterized protein n=1 Tax=Wolfiporia cocos (strain MD-104) TaxID=742152 RepID=A0A2H3JBL4_WOLCO|nr:hypothetical protein WOLCODRAFT_133703 [Wolfiporia cocos MD-104 SS10]
MATRCSSPPESVFTSWSRMGSRFMGFTTSVLNCGCINDALIRFNSSMRTVPGNDGEIVCGLSETESVCLSVSSSGVSPASRRMNVVLPIPFSPSITMISESWRVLSMISSSAVSTILKVSESSRNRRFSVGMKPSRKMQKDRRYKPSRTE